MLVGREIKELMYLPTSGLPLLKSYCSTSSMQLDVGPMKCGYMAIDSENKSALNHQSVTSPTSNEGKIHLGLNFISRLKF